MVVNITKNVASSIFNNYITDVLLLSESPVLNISHHILLSTTGQALLTLLGDWHGIIMIPLKHIGLSCVCVCIGHVNMTHSIGLGYMPNWSWDSMD